MGKTIHNCTVHIDDGEKDNSFLKSARDIGFILAIYLYLIGWVYFYYYLKDFGISIHQVDVDFYNLITYSIDVIKYLIAALVAKIQLYGIWIACISIIIIGIATILYLKFRNKLSKWHKAARERRIILLFKYFVLIISLIAAYWVALKAGYYNKNRDQIRKYSQLHTIKFEFKEAKTSEVTSLIIKPVPKSTGKAGSIASTDSTNIIKYNAAGDLRLLIADKEAYYVYKSDSTVTWNDVGAVQYEVFIVQRESIQNAKITD